jgi:mRNA-degrading endonuclease toxin of MazEF toxin-antitoxin module
MERGDIYVVDLEPTQGHEQRGKRPVLIVSTAEFNKLSPALICPIATAAVGQRLAGLTVTLQGAGTSTTGVVLCAQVRALDLKARKGHKMERVPDFIVEQVLDCLRDIFE